MRLDRVALFLLLPLLLTACGAKMPKFGFGARDSRPPPLAELAQPVPDTAYGFCGYCLLDKDGKQVPTSAAIRGYFESAERKGDKVEVRGWAADIEAKAPAAEMIIIAKGKVVARGRPTQARPDVVQALQLPATTQLYGFMFSIDVAQIGDPVVNFAIDRAGKAQSLDVIVR
jgi:hypothetical protein